MSPADDESPAARALRNYLEPLRADSPQPGAELVPEIVRRARWQRAVRAPLRAAAGLVAALADGISVLTGSGGGRRR